MGGLSRRAVGSTILACLLVVALNGRASAESALWTLVASPLAVTTGVLTDFSLTGTNEDPLAAALSSNEIGCVVVDVPTTFTVATAWVTGSTAGGSWTASLAGNRVRVRAGSGGDRLSTLDSVSFRIRATAQSPGSPAWSSRAYRQQDCSGAGTLVNLPPIVVVSGPAVTPTPVPTPVVPSPTPLPTIPPSLAPTPAPTARASITPAPSRSPSPTGTPPSGADSSPSAGDLASPTPRSVSAGGLTAPRSGPGAGAEAQLVDLRIPQFDGAGATVGLDVPLFGFAGAGFTWLVPAALGGVAGFVVLGWVALQTVAALIWIPAIRRLREERAGRVRTLR